MCLATFKMLFINKMSDIQQTHNIIIIDNKNGGNYVKMVDCLRPKSATKCFVSIDKFQASILMDDGYVLPSHNVILSINGVENSYVNNSESNIIVRSQIVDSFMTDKFTTVPIVVLNGVVNVFEKYALYNCLNNKDNWLEINANDLNSFKIVMKSATTETDFQNPVQYNDIPIRFQFFIHLKIKFE